MPKKLTATAVKLNNINIILNRSEPEEYILAVDGFTIFSNDDLLEDETSVRTNIEFFLSKEEPSVQKIIKEIIKLAEAKLKQQSNLE